MPFCRMRLSAKRFIAGVGGYAAEALAPMGAKAQVASEIGELVRQVRAAARPGDHIVCMSNGSFSDVHGKLLLALANVAEGAGVSAGP